MNVPVALTRSENMSRIRGKNTAPELALRKALWAQGKRYRLHYKTPGGRADLAFPGQKFAVFVDGCFWHGCPEHYTRPSSNAPFWERKLRENVERDRRQTQALISAGWRFLRLWEHEVASAPEAAAQRIAASIPAPGADTTELWRVVDVKLLSESPRLEDRRLETLTLPIQKKSLVLRRNIRSNPLPSGSHGES